MNEFKWQLPKSGHQVVPQANLRRALEEAPNDSNRATATVRGSLGELQVSGDESGRSDELWIQPLEPPTRADSPWRRYAPLRDTPALFRTFVDVECKQESIVGFADRFGLLTDPEKGEPLDTWRISIEGMQSAVNLWESVQQSDVVLTPGNYELLLGAGFSPHLGSCTQADAAHMQGSFAAATPVGSAVDDVDVTAQLPKGAKPVLQVLTHPDRDHALEFLAHEINRRISRRVFISFNYDSLLDRLALRLMPTNLLEAMWLQFGQAVELNKTFRRCRHCSTWFDLSPKAARVDKVFCTEACKAREYRRRLAKNTESWINAPSDASTENPEVK